MDSKVNYSLVGFFVIILSIALVASILWLGFGTQNNNYQTYQAYIQESVSGLNRKAAVKYRGVEVGYVRDITLVTERPNEIQVLLDIKPGVPLKQDTLVTLSTQGLTGLAHIELTGGSHDAPPPVRQPAQKYPELKTKPSLLVRLDTTLSNLLKNLDETALANILQATNNINIISQKGVTLVTQLENSLAALEKTSNAFTQTAEMVNQVLESNQQHFEETTQAVAKTAAEVSVAVNESRQDLNYFTRQALPEVTHSLHELRVLLIGLRHFSQELERQPNMLFFGKTEVPPGPGE